MQVYYPLHKSGASGAIVQRITRQSDGLKRAFQLVKGKKMAENWLFSYTNPNCTHSDTCGCQLKIVGRGKDTSGLSWDAPPLPVKEQLFEAAIWMEAWAKTQNGIEINTTEEYLRAKVTRDSSIRMIDAPMKVQPSWPTDVVLPTPSLEIQNALKRSDYVDFEELGLGYSFEEMEKWVWSDQTPRIPNTETRDHPEGATEIRPLWAMAMRVESKYYWACGLTNGRPHAVSAMNNMYPRKLPDAILKFDRTEPTERMKEALELTEPILANMYRMMGLDLSQKRQYVCTFKTVEDMYLGAASGLMPSKPPELIKLAYDEYIKISNRGKKIDFHEQVLLQLYKFIIWGIEPTIVWVAPPKNEVYFEFWKQWSDVEWMAFLNKVRIFNIPSSIHIYLERVGFLERHLLERGKQIRIGSKWGHGGSDSLAECLGVDLTNCWDGDIVEGDFKGFDQSVRNTLMKIYYAAGSIHYDENSPDFPIYERIVTFIMKHALYRVTYLMGRLWCVIRGSVASGRYDTSHKDSWITSFVFSGFLTWILFKTPQDQQEELELYIIAVIKMVCYGDDHLYKIGVTKWSVLFGGDQWSFYCKEYWNMDIRDLKTVSFCSRHRNGWITKIGACFLKYLQVINENKGPGQPNFLPYRETRDFIVRAVYSREPKVRDSIDVMMSVIGQAYSTYASNYNAYTRLRNFYQQLYEGIQDRSSIQEKMSDRLRDAQDIRRIRQMGITPEELVHGFPTYQCLVDKNVVDKSYQDNSRNEIGYDISDDMEGYY